MTCQQERPDTLLQRPSRIQIDFSTSTTKIENWQQLATYDTLRTGDFRSAVDDVSPYAFP